MVELIAGFNFSGLFRGIRKPYGFGGNHPVNFGKRVRIFYAKHCRGLCPRPGRRLNFNDFCPAVATRLGLPGCHFQQLLVRITRLVSRQENPAVITGPKKYSQWLALLPPALKHTAQQFASLSEVSGFICESGYMLGSDSGIAHLASNLGLPTLSVFGVCSSYNRNLWRPGWGKNHLLKPSLPLPAVWKHLLSVNQVCRAFLRLQQEFPYGVQLDARPAEAD